MPRCRASSHRKLVEVALWYISVARHVHERAFNLGFDLSHLPRPLSCPCRRICPSSRRRCAKRRPELRAVCGQHYQDEHDGVDQHPVVVEAAQGLGQYGQDGRGDYAAPYLAQTAEHDEHEDEYRGVEVELCGGEVGKIEAVECAGGPARAALVTKAISLYLVTLMPTLSAAMRLSRRAMMARPERLRTRLSTITSVTMMRMKPAVKPAIVSVPVAPARP